MDGYIKNSFVENWLSQAQYPDSYRPSKPLRNGSRTQQLPEWADSDFVQGPAGFTDGHFQPYSNTSLIYSTHSSDQNRTARQFSKQFQESHGLNGGVNDKRSSRSSAIGTSPSSTTAFSTPSSTELPSKSPQQNPSELLLPNSEEPQYFNFFAPDQPTSKAKPEGHANGSSSDSTNASYLGAVRTNSMSAGSSDKPASGFFKDGVFRPYRRFQRGVDLKPSRALEFSQKTGCFTAHEERSAAGASTAGQTADSEMHSDSCSVSQHSDPGSSLVPWEPESCALSSQQQQPLPQAHSHQQHSQLHSWRDPHENVYSYGERDARPPKVLAIGDSFLGPLTLFKRDALRTLKFKGASARGLANPDSTTGANEKTLAALAECDAFVGHRPAALLFFGNVDVHVNIFFKLSQDQALDVDAYLRESVERYAEFLRGARKRFARLELAAVSVLLPVVQAAWLFESLKFYTRSSHDPQQQRQLTELLAARPELASLEWREERTRYFNQLLRRACADVGVAFVDANEGLLDAHGHIDSKFIDASHANIHLLWEPIIPFWIERLGKYGIRQSDLRRDLSETFGEYRKSKMEQLNEFVQKFGLKPATAQTNDSICAAAPTDSASYSTSSNQCTNATTCVVGDAAGAAGAGEQQVNGCKLDEKELQARERLFAERMTYNEFAAQYDALAADPAVKTVENNGVLIINRK